MRTRLLIALLLLTAGLLCSSCTYPEEGYYELIALDGWLNPVARQAFMVEELVDDTNLTYGFAALLPSDGGLIEIELENDQADRSRRAWFLDLADADTGHGNLMLELAHIYERLTLSGLYWDGTSVATHELNGVVKPGRNPQTSDLYFADPLPKIKGIEGRAAYFELRTITQAEFEDVLGVTVELALRREGAVPPDMSELPVAKPGEQVDSKDTNEQAEDVDDEDAGEPETKPDKDKPKRKPPNLGGRR